MTTSAGQKVTVNGTGSSTAVSAITTGENVLVLGTTGEYEVHYIAVNWPHHIFDDQDVAVVGAD
jgi:hypothetical protein